MVNVCIPPNLAVVFSLTVTVSLYRPGVTLLSIDPVMAPLVALRVRFPGSILVGGGTFLYSETQSVFQPVAVKYSLIKKSVGVKYSFKTMTCVRFTRLPGKKLVLKKRLGVDHVGEMDIF